MVDGCNQTAYSPYLDTRSTLEQLMLYLVVHMKIAKFSEKVNNSLVMLFFCNDCSLHSLYETHKKHFTLYYFKF